MLLFEKLYFEKEIMLVLRIVTLLFIASIFSSLLSCFSIQRDPVLIQNEGFLEIAPDTEEVFRVLIISNEYLYSQMKFSDTIKRIDDTEGDRNICDKLKKLNKIDIVRDGIISVWLFPDSGLLMKVRPKALTYLREIDNLIVEDVMRWNFEFPQEVIEPISFDIKYRVILRKKQSEDEIMREVREKIREKRGSR